jgi:hypothetical protein
MWRTSQEIQEPWLLKAWKNDSAYEALAGTLARGSIMMIVNLTAISGVTDMHNVSIGEIQ